MPQHKTITGVEPMTFLTIRERADQVRAIPLKNVLLAMGAEPDRYDKAKWHTVQGVLSVTDTKFINWNQGKGGGGAIDLAMHLNNLDFKAAVQWLWLHFPNPYPKQRHRPANKPALRLPPRNEQMLSGVRRYLVIERGIPHCLLDPLIESGTLYADNYANAVFLLLGKENKPVGAELRGTARRPWRGMAPGSNKDMGYFSVSPPQTQAIVLCESAIDAISCFALHPYFRCISTSGARPNPPWLIPLIKKADRVYCGFDSDPTGESMARAMISNYPKIKRLRPSNHDWNDVLNSQR
jgi:hypothetical protein